jgi:hypothetical protein
MTSGALSAVASRDEVPAEDEVRQAVAGGRKRTNPGFSHFRPVDSTLLGTALLEDE